MIRLKPKFILAFKIFIFIDVLGIVAGLSLMAAIPTQMIFWSNVALISISITMGLCLIALFKFLFFDND